MSGDKAHSEVRIASEDYRRGWDEAFASPWRTCSECGMTREKTRLVGLIAVMPICERCDRSLRAARGDEPESIDRCWAGR